MASHKKKEKTSADAQINLMPMMSLFSILIPYLLMCASFSSIKIIGLDLPETRIMTQVDAPVKDKEDEGLLLTVFITDDGITLGAKGAMLPTTYVREIHKYEYHYPKNSENQFEYLNPVNKKNKTIMPECPKEKGRKLTLYERSEIILYALFKENEQDSGKLIPALYNMNNEVMCDGSGRILSSNPRPGDTLYTLGAERRMNVVKPDEKYAVLSLTVYDELASRLLRIRSQYPNMPDIGEIKLVASDDVVFDKLVHIMDVCRLAGFPKINLAKLAV